LRRCRQLGLAQFSLCRVSRRLGPRLLERTLSRLGLGRVWTRLRPGLGHRPHGLGLGSALYSGWGYMPYSNPHSAYAMAPVGGAQPVYDYSQPIDTTSAPPDQSVSDQAVAAFDQARDAFKAGDYTTALNLTDQALKAMPNDPSIHEFRAQVLIAL